VSVKYSWRDDGHAGGLPLLQHPIPNNIAIAHWSQDAVQILARGIIQQHEQVTILEIFEHLQDCNILHTSVQNLEQQAARRWHTYDTAKRLGHASKQEAHRIIQDMIHKLVEM
jgi:hypothetical protein